MSNNVGKDFINATKYFSHTPSPSSPQQQGLPQPSLELPFPIETKIIPLPKPAKLNIPNIDLRQAIETRRTLRQFSETKLTIEELSFLLWLTQGVKEVISRPATLRTVPSAGARHAFETYLLINRVENLDAGLYRFGAMEHVLAKLEASPSIAEDLTHACMDQKSVLRSGVTFIWVAVVERMYWRYAERGYRYLHLDAGHVCQNLYLAAEAIDCGVCAIAAFYDDEVNTCLGLDGTNQFAIYIGTIGKKLK